MNAILLNIILLCMLAVGNESIFSEHFIGKSKSEITQIVNEKYKSFKLNTAYINNAYNYLKYEDKIREITILFFLNEKDNCRMIRVMSDYSNLRDLHEELNTNYKKIKNNNWQYEAGGELYNVALEEGDWFFTITIEI
jgi:putative IMPACT (imprinted ancient) family translation regulator